VTNIKDKNFIHDMLKGLSGGKKAINRSLVSGGHYWVRAVNAAPELVGSDGSADMEDGGGYGAFLPLGRYDKILEESRDAIASIREKREQYRDGNEERIYMRNRAAGCDNSKPINTEYTKIFDTVERSDSRHERSFGTGMRQGPNRREERDKRFRRDSDAARRREPAPYNRRDGGGHREIPRATDVSEAASGKQR